jgi:RNA polymerase sigma-70 factor (ECF subfamily)
VESNPTATANPYERTVQRETVQIVRQLIDALPEKQRATVLLRVCDDLSFREIGELVGSSEASAKVNFFHAVKKLRGWMQPDAMPAVAPEEAVEGEEA